VRVQIADIPEDGLRIRFRGEDARWDSLKDLFVQTAPSGHLFVQRRGQDIFVQGEAHMALSFDCSRCLETFLYPVEASIRQMLHPEGSNSLGSKEIELAPDDLEHATYSGEELLLEGVVEEHLLLSLPMRPLCSEDCRGLCPGCGANRNHRECTCPEGSGKSPFDCLKDFVVKER
jgi:uncharacterized protein